jgi:hypothetical protein
MYFPRELDLLPKRNEQGDKTVYFSTESNFTWSVN